MADSTVKCSRSRLTDYFVGVVALAVIWSGVLIPTIFFVMPESKSTMNRSNETSLLEECRRLLTNNQTKFCESLISEEDSAVLCFVIKSLDRGGLVEEMRALTALLGNCSAFNFDFMKRYAGQYNLSENLWLPPCYAPLVREPRSFRCDPPCILPELNHIPTAARHHLSAFTFVTSLLSGLISFATWMSLPFMSSFPHVVPLYIVGSTVVLDFFLALPGFLSIQTAFCSSLTSDDETVFCFVQGIVLQYCILFSSLWFLCYSLNIYMVVVHNKPHIILGNRRTYFIQSLICWLLPIVRFVIQFCVPSQHRYFEWMVTDYFICVPGDLNMQYYTLIVPSQLIIGIGATLLIHTVIFLLLGEQDVSGMKILQDTSKSSGITSLGKRLGALSFALVTVGIYFPSAVSYLKTLASQKIEDVALFIVCKHMRDDCDDGSLREFDVAPLMISLNIVAALFTLFVSLLLIGTPAQIKLWKCWVASLFLFCHIPDPDGKYKSWKEDSELARYRLSATSARRRQVQQRAQMAKRQTTPEEEIEMEIKNDGSFENLMEG